MFFFSGRATDSRSEEAEKKYDQEVSKLNVLIEKKKEMESKELLDAFRNSSRSCQEVLDFLQSK